MKRLQFIGAYEIVAVFIALLPACATIIKGKTETVEFVSNPSGADVTVRDEDGQLVEQSVTPCELSLRRGDGYFSSKHYRVQMQLPGYQAVDIELSPRVNMWYGLGNLVFGGLIGYLIVDPLTGAMYTIAKEPVRVEFPAAANP